MIDITYVYEGIEVKPTGRIATKQLKRGRTLTMIEVTPYDNSIERWKKWANEEDLLQITTKNFEYE